MESRSALRQRIERLVDFRAPRKAGLTFASLCGIFVFSAVALPMGQGPARLEPEAKHVSAPIAAIQPEAFPSTNLPSVLITAQIFQSRAIPDGHSLSTTAMPRKAFQKILESITTNEYARISSPRILTTSGLPGEMFIGNETNHVSFSCLPVVKGGLIDLSLQGTCVTSHSGGAATNQFSAQEKMENMGGLMLVVRDANNSVLSNLIVLVSAEIVTNGDTRFQPRLAPIQKRVSGSLQSRAQELVQDGKLLYEMGKLDEADAKLSEAIQVDPANTTAQYYLKLVQQAKPAHGLPPVIRPSGTNALVYTGPGRQAIVAKLRNIRLDTFSTGGSALPLNEVLRQLTEQVRMRDPQRKGVNFLINNGPARSGAPKPAAPFAAIDPATGLPAQMDLGSSAPASDLGLLPITIQQALNNVTLEEALDAVVKAAPKPIRYSIQDFAVVFSVVGPPELFMRTFLLGNQVYFDDLRRFAGPVTNGASKLTDRFFKKFGLDAASPPGKVVFFHDHGYVFVKATLSDLDAIERTFQQNNQTSLATNSQYSSPSVPTNASGLLADPNYRAALPALERRTGVTNLVTTSSGRGSNRTTLTNSSSPLRMNIMMKLDHIRLDKFSTGSSGKPLRDVLAQLNNESKWRDPERKGIDFSINPGGTNTSALDDVGAATIKIANLTDVRLADVLDAILLVAERPIKYSIQDFGVVFSARNSENAPLFMRTFRVDPNTFYRGLEHASMREFDSIVTNGTRVLDDNTRQNQGESAYGTTQTSASSPSVAVKQFFTRLGIDFEHPPGKSVFLNDRLGLLFVKATESDLDTIERALQVLIQAPPQIHIKARFYEVSQDGGAWSLLLGGGQSSSGVVMNGSNLTGSASSPMPANPLSSNTAQSTNQTVAELAGILTDPNFRVALNALQSRNNTLCLGEPEVTTLSGRQTQMRATEVKAVITNLTLETYSAGATRIVPQTENVETGPILDVVPYVLADGYTLNLALIPSMTEFLGYDSAVPTNNLDFTEGVPGKLPAVSPRFGKFQKVATLNVWDNQTVVFSLNENFLVNGQSVAKNAKMATKKVFVFVTATIVDSAGNRVHTDDQLPFAQKGVPTQPLPAK